MYNYIRIMMLYQQLWWNNFLRFSISEYLTQSDLSYMAPHTISKYMLGCRNNPVKILCFKVIVLQKVESKNQLMYIEYILCSNCGNYNISTSNLHRYPHGECVSIIMFAFGIFFLIHLNIIIQVRQVSLIILIGKPYC